MQQWSVLVAKMVYRTGRSESSVERGGAEILSHCSWKVCKSQAAQRLRPSLKVHGHLLAWRAPYAFSH